MLKVTWLWVKTNGTIFGVGAPPILVYVGGDWDVLGVRDFGPWPHHLQTMAHELAYAASWAVSWDVVGLSLKGRGVEHGEEST